MTNAAVLLNSCLRGLLSCEVSSFQKISLACHAPCQETPFRFLSFLLNTSCNDVSERCLRTPGCLLMRSQRIFQRSSLCPTSRSTRFQANLSSSSDALFRSSKGLDRVLIFDASWSLQHSCGPCDGNGSVALLLAHRLRHGVKLIFPNVHLRTVFPMRAWL